MTSTATPATPEQPDNGLERSPDGHRVPEIVSIAISLKRIADALEGFRGALGAPVNEYGEPLFEAIAGTLRRELRS